MTSIDLLSSSSMGIVIVSVYECMGVNVSVTNDSICHEKAGESEEV